MALMPVAEALARLTGDAAPLPGESVPLADAAWRVLAADVVARRTQPPFDASAMDGYAVRAVDVATVPSTLRVIGEAPAGRRFGGIVGPGEAVRIFTGAPMPRGADTILIQENATVLEGGGLRADETVAAGRHIRRAGLDFRSGDTLLKAGRVLDPAALSLAASANHPTLDVVRRPVVAILATGDELVAPSAEPGADQIVSSNSFGVAAAVSAAGGVALDLGIVLDRLEAIAAAIGRARAQGADVLVTLGGASVGDHDLVQRALVEAGMDLDFWKIAMRPGKPLMFGRLGALRVLGLPGNPVASLVCSQVFLVPLIARLAGRPHATRLCEATLGADMAANDQRQDYVRARVKDTADGLVATPFDIQDSSMLRLLAEAGGLIVRPPFAPAAARGSRCDVLLLR